MTRYTLVILFCLPLFAQDFTTDVIKDPSISRRCQNLLEKRQKKIEIKQRLSSLQQRNERLQKITPAQKVSVKTKLEENLSRVKRELRLINFNITRLEERIVRQGCPGIRL